MDRVQTIIGISNLVIGIICLVLAIPLLRGRIAPNRLYGVRFRESFASTEAWYAINHFGAKRMIGWSLLLLAIGAAVFLAPKLPDWSLAIGAFAPLVCVLVPAIETWMFARRYQADQ